jgi:hypothetical protein
VVGTSPLHPIEINDTKKPDITTPKIQKINPDPATTTGAGQGHAAIFPRHNAASVSADNTGLISA